jgi:hypothetical protein
MLHICETTPDASEFIKKSKNLLVARDSRVLKVIDARTDQFGEFMIASLSPEIYKLESPETRDLAKKWLARPLPDHRNRPKAFADNQQADAWQKAYSKWDTAVERHFWSCMFLLKGNSEDQQLGVNELCKLFDEVGLGTKVTWSDQREDSPYTLRTNLRFKIEGLLKCKRKDARELACRLGNLPDPNRENLQATRVLFNAGCVEALKSLSETLRAPVSEPDIIYVMEAVNGKDIRLPLSYGDFLVRDLLGQQWMFGDGYHSFLYPDWGPPGFTYSETDPVEVRKQKREQLAQWLEKKFQEIKQGKSPPLSVGTGYPM